MRIIAGRSKGRILESVKGNKTRPTYHRVKEALFSIIQNRLPGSLVLDLFSGTGNLGIEALSRGSLKAVFVDRDRNAISVLKRNCTNLGYEKQAKIIHKDVHRAIRELGNNEYSFDLIFVDPPYGKGFEISTLKAISDYNILNPDGVVAVEHLASDTQPVEIGRLKKFDWRIYGNTGISFYRKE